MKVSNVIRLIAFIYLLVLVTLSCNRSDEFPMGKSIFCDAESSNKTGKKFVAANDSSAFFDGGKRQTTNESYSGKHSVMTIPKKGAFAFGHKIKHAGSDWYFVLSVWRKSKDGKGVLVAAGKDSKILYEATSIPIEKQSDGWEKLELEVYTPPNFNNQEIKFYVWNNGTDTVYFDDLEIHRLEKKAYPAYTIEPFALITDTSDYLKIVKKRKLAFESGILQTSDNDWVKGFIINNDETMKVRIRLKGDWLDHLQGDKWSFRIKMRKNFAWNRLRAFSIQTPASRDFLLEWVAHELYYRSDMLTTRYGFIPVYLNNEPKGIYAWEEHFTKQLLEFNNRREGPILKFSEDAFWQVQKIFKKADKWQQLPYYEASVIKPFGENRTIRSPNLRSQFLNGQKLLYQYKQGLNTPSEIFDIEKLATYYAMLELTQARHGMFWHNQRYYYNPVIDKLEPIAFDGYSFNAEIDVSMEENFLYKIFNMEEVKPEEKIFTDLFYDEVFINLYFEKLDEFSEPAYIETIVNKLAEEQNYYDSLLRMEFPRYYFDKGFIKKSAESIRNYLPSLKQFAFGKMAASEDHFKNAEMNYSDTTVFENTPEFFVNVYQEEKVNDSMVIRICNYFPKEITILGTGESNKYITGPDFNQNNIPLYTGGAEGPEIFMEVDSSAKFLFFVLDTSFDTYVVPIYPWAYPGGTTSRQDLVSGSSISDYPFIILTTENEIIFKTGEYQIDQPVIIPEGYRVIFEKGTRIDFVNHSMFLSYSPVYIKGKQNEPVIITSSDFSANAFTVLQSKGRSKIEHVIFENLNTLNYKGWQQTGAVTFYESDVDILHAKFYRNQCEDALNIIRSDFSLENSEFSYTFGDAFDADFCSGKVVNTEFINVVNDAIDFSGSKIDILNVTITEVGDKGISSGEDSDLYVENTKIERAGVGIASKDLSTVTIKDSYVLDCEYGLLLLRKKPEYGSASMELINTQIVNPKTVMLIEKGSKVIVDGKTIEGTEINLGELFY